MKFDDGYIFDQCPNCGSSERAVESEIKAAFEKGLVREDAFQAALQTEAIIADPQCIPDLVGVKVKATKLVGYYDVCIDCGTLYCVRMERKPVAIGAQANARSGGSRHPSGG